MLCSGLAGGVGGDGDQGRPGPRVDAAGGLAVPTGLEGAHPVPGLGVEAARHDLGVQAELVEAALQLAHPPARVAEAQGR